MSVRTITKTAATGSGTRGERDAAETWEEEEAEAGRTGEKGATRNGVRSPRLHLQKRCAVNLGAAAGAGAGEEEQAEGGGGERSEAAAAFVAGLVLEFHFTGGIFRALAKGFELEL